ncbi:MAG: hypothetical protein AB1413_05820 [Thermodesulfobacteriota bacterium]
MSKGAFGRIWSGLQAQGGAQLVQMGIRFVEVPLFLNFWGAELYGHWLILFALPAYFSLADLGFNGVAAREMAMLVARGEHQKTLQIFQSLALIVFALATVLLLFVILLSGVLSSVFFQDAGFDTGKVMIFLAFYVWFRLQIGSLYSAFYSQGYYAYGVVLMSFLQAGEFVMVVAALALGGDTIQLSQVYALVAGGGYLVVRIILHAKLPLFRYGTSNFRWSLIRRLSKPALAALAFPVGFAMSQQGMRLVVGLISGPASVTLFVASRTLTGLATRLHDAFGQTLEPEYARAHGGDDRATMQKLLLLGTQATFWMSIVILGGLWVFGEPFFRHWTAGRIGFNRGLFVLLLAVSFVNAIWFNVMKVAYATNRHTKAAVIFFVSYTIACFAAIPLTYTLGIIGAALALLFTEFVITFYVVPPSLRLVNLDARSWILAIIKPPKGELVHLMRVVFGKKNSSGH